MRVANAFANATVISGHKTDSLAAWAFTTRTGLYFPPIQQISRYFSFTPIPACSISGVWKDNAGAKFSSSPTPVPTTSTQQALLCQTNPVPA
jgi:hypothetical protein